MPNSALRQNRFLQPGLKPALELLRDAPQTILRVYCKKESRELERIKELCSRSSLPLEFLDNEGLRRLGRANPGSPQTHQGVVVELKPPLFRTDAEIIANAPSAPLPLVLALDQVQDTGNLGTLCRSAYALGCAGVILPEHNGAKIGPGAYRASAGALAKLPVAMVTNLARSLDKFDEAGYSICAAAKTSPEAIVNAFEYSWSFPCVLILGGENKGVRPNVLKRCHRVLSIPFARPFDSLNVAQAGAMLLALCAAGKNRNNSQALRTRLIF